VSASVISNVSTPTVAWSRRVRRIGGFIQAAFAALWLTRGGLAVGGVVGTALVVVFGFVAVVVFAYGIRVTAAVAPRPPGPEARRIERDVTVATVIQLVASFTLPVIVVAAGQPDWVLPSVAITIGPLLLWLDRRVDIPRYRAVGWVLIVGPVLAVATMSGTALTVVTGLTAGALLLGTAAAGFHDLASLRPLPAGPPASTADGPVRL
jgi:hypothetical protein